MRPSRSKSPQANPRCSATPARVRPENEVLPFVSRRLGCFDCLPDESSALSITWPLALNRSFHPSLLKAAITFDHPVHGRVSLANPEAIVTSSKMPCELLRNRGNVSL